jgi:hypothetical protein
MTGRNHIRPRFERISIIFGDYELMKTSDPQIRGKIVFHFDAVDHRFWLDWCQLEVDGIFHPWKLHTDFKTVLETIAYAKNLILKDMTEKDLADKVEHVVWWIKGDQAYYCPKCMTALSHEAKARAGPLPQEVLSLRCDQCQTEVFIPADAFAFQ